MSHNQQLKRQILRQAVADNVSTRNGAPPTRRPGREPARRSTPPWRLVALILIPLAAVPFVLRTFDSTSAASSAAAANSATPSSATTDIPTTAEPAPTFARPTPLGDGVLPLAVRRVVVDAGHGGDDHGTATGDGSEALIEKDLTLDIARRLAAHLERGGFEVMMTRTDDQALSLRDRSRMANEGQADVFVSIHVNWFGAHHVRGVETFYLGATEDPDLNALARRENQESGYSMADMRSLLDGIYADVRKDESRHLASHVQRALYRSLLPTNPTLRDRGVKTAPFVVLVATEMPAILAEVSCLSNRDEAERLARPLYREHIAEALYRGIETYAHDVNQTEGKGS